MAHGVSEVLSEETSSLVKMQKSQQVIQQQNVRKSLGVMGSRRIFAPAFKLKVLDSYRNDIDCRGNQRATARKYGIHRRQIQKWLQCEDNLRNSCAESGNNNNNNNNLSSSVPTSNNVVTKQQDNIICNGSSNIMPVTETTTGPLVVAVAPAAPALNLSLARLHGDELATQQASGPPPSHHQQHHHPHHHRQDHQGPPSPHCINADNNSPNVENVVILNSTAMSSYADYQKQNQELESRIQVSEVRYELLKPDSDVERYYTLDEEKLKSREINSSQRYSPEGNKVYQCLTSYHHSIHQYNHDEILSTSHCSPNEHERFEDSTADSEKRNKAYMNSNSRVLLAPSMIKMERTSPDLAATPGPYEQACSPGDVSSSRLSHFVDPSSSSSSSSSLSEISPSARITPTNSNTLLNYEHSSSRASVSPSNLRVGPENIHSPTRTITPDSEKKPIMFLESKGEESRMRETSIKEELELNEENIHRMKDNSLSVCYAATHSPCPQEQNCCYASSPSSPLISSGTSTSSCSDNELDSLTCTCGRHNSANDFNRRRSFSLRFKLDVLDAFHHDVSVAGNQRATARKFGINRRQVQKWLGQEIELRGEIALRGNSRQRLGPIQDSQEMQETACGENMIVQNSVNSAEALDLTTTSSTTPTISQGPEYNRLTPPTYFCDVIGSSQQQNQYYNNQNLESLETESNRICNLSCCTSPNQSCYPGYTEQTSYCYSPKSSELSSSVPEPEQIFSPSKRSSCTLSCCYELPPSKKLCLDMETIATTRITSCQLEETPPQETPLCLVKSEKTSSNEEEVVSFQTREPVTSTVPTPPTVPPTPSSIPASKKDAILFKPYLDNPLVTKPSSVKEQRLLSPVSAQNINNNNCQSICNLNEERRTSGNIHHDYNLELSFRVPVSCISWRTQPNHYVDFPQVKSAFVRYPTSSPYT